MPVGGRGPPPRSLGADLRLSVQRRFHAPGQVLGAALAPVVQEDARRRLALHVAVDGHDVDPRLAQGPAQVLIPIWLPTSHPQDIFTTRPMVALYIPFCAAPLVLPSGKNTASS